MAGVEQGTLNESVMSGTVTQASLEEEISHYLPSAVSSQGQQNTVWEIRTYWQVSVGLPPGHVRKEVYFPG